jgi:O-antigen ligase
VNLFLAGPSRRQQRALLATIAGNAVLLAVVGSAFKLAHARRILGTFDSPNENFFATFVYYNHWGGFALLGAAAAGGLALYYRDRAPGGEWSQTPAAMLAAFVLILLVTLPMSGARASMLAGYCLTLFLAVRVVPQSARRHARRWRTLSVCAAFAILGGATLWVARDRLEFLFRKTSNQLAELHAGGMGDARLAIDRETWRLFLARPVFGWGWQSFRYVFRRDQTFDLRMQNEQKTKTQVRDAHNDWLQLLAELGLLGAVLSLLTLRGWRRAASTSSWRRSPSSELVAGAACVGLLACIDFPFACPAIVVTWWSLVATAAGIAHDRDRLKAVA